MLARDPEPRFWIRRVHERPSLVKESKRPIVIRRPGEGPGQKKNRRVGGTPRPIAVEIDTDGECFDPGSRSDCANTLGLTALDRKRERGLPAERPFRDSKLRGLKPSVSRHRREAEGARVPAHPGML